VKRGYLVGIEGTIGNITIPEEESKDAVKEERKLPIMVNSSDSIMKRLR